MSDNTCSLISQPLFALRSYCLFAGRVLARLVALHCVNIDGNLPALPGWKAIGYEPFFYLKLVHDSECRMRFLVIAEQSLSNKKPAPALRPARARTVNA